MQPHLICRSVLTEAVPSLLLPCSYELTLTNVQILQELSTAKHEPHCNIDNNQCNTVTIEMGVVSVEGSRQSWKYEGESQLFESNRINYYKSPVSKVQNVSVPAAKCIMLMRWCISRQSWPLWRENVPLVGVYKMQLLDIAFVNIKHRNNMAIVLWIEPRRINKLSELMGINKG